MDPELITRFIEKFVHIIQAPSFYKKNLLPWLNSLFQIHFFTLASMNQDHLAALKQVQTLIANRTKNLNRLLEVQSKLDNLANIFGSTSTRENTISSAKKSTYEPLLVYNESDSEEETQTSIFYKFYL